MIFFCPKNFCLHQSHKDFLQSFLVDVFICSFHVFILWYISSECLCMVRGNDWISIFPSCWRDHPFLTTLVSPPKYIKKWLWTDRVSQSFWIPHYWISIICLMNSLLMYIFIVLNEKNATPLYMSLYTCKNISFLCVWCWRWNTQPHTHFSKCFITELHP